MAHDSTSNPRQEAEIAPTTDCPACGRSAKECNDSKAKGWDNCCQTCDAAGHVATHRLRATSPAIQGGGDGS